MQHIQLFPLDKPLHPTTFPLVFPFRINHGGWYQIEVEAERALHNEAERSKKHVEVSCRLGLQGSYGSDNACPNLPRAIDFDWQLFQNERLVARGKYSDELAGSYSGDTIAAQFTQFAAKSGQYQLQIPKPLVSEVLDPNNLHIRVKLERDPIGFALIELGSAVVGTLVAILGAILVMMAVVRRKRDRHP